MPQQLVDLGRRAVAAVDGPAAGAAYDPDAQGYFVDEKHEAGNVRAAREAAISYAAYRVLLHRYSLAAGMEATFDALVATMESL